MATPGVWVLLYGSIISAQPQARELMSAMCCGNFSGVKYNAQQRLTPVSAKIHKAVMTTKPTISRAVSVSITIILYLYPKKLIFNKKTMWLQQESAAKVRAFTHNAIKPKQFYKFSTGIIDQCQKKCKAYVTTASSVTIQLTTEAFVLPSKTGNYKFVIREMLFLSIVSHHRCLYPMV